MSTANAKQIDLPHGTIAEAWRRYNNGKPEKEQVTRMTFWEWWTKEKEVAVDLVLQVVKEWKEGRDGVKQKIQQIETEIQTA